MKKQEPSENNQPRKRKKSGSEFFLRYFTLFILIVFLNLTLGCSNYYKINTITTNYSEETESLRFQNKFFVLNDGTDLYLLDSIRINDDNTGIYARINPIPAQIEKSLDAINRYTRRYYKSEKNILQQVHVYTNGFTQVDDLKVLVPFSSIDKMQVFEKDDEKPERDYLLRVTTYNSTQTLKGRLCSVTDSTIVISSGICNPQFYSYNENNIEISVHDIKVIKVRKENSIRRGAITGGILVFSATQIAGQILFVERDKSESFTLISERGQLFLFLTIISIIPITSFVPIGIGIGAIMGSKSIEFPIEGQISIYQKYRNELEGFVVAY